MRRACRSAWKGPRPGRHCRRTRERGWCRYGSAAPCRKSPARRDNIESVGPSIQSKHALALTEQADQPVHPPFTGQHCSQHEAQGKKAKATKCRHALYLRVAGLAVGSRAGSATARGRRGSARAGLRAAAAAHAANQSQVSATRVRSWQASGWKQRQPTCRSRKRTIRRSPGSTVHRSQSESASVKGGVKDREMGIHLSVAGLCGGVTRGLGRTVAVSHRRLNAVLGLHTQEDNSSRHDRDPP